jgi:iron complex transport system permease protein
MTTASAPAGGRGPLLRSGRARAAGLAAAVAALLLAALASVLTGPEPVGLADLPAAYAGGPASETDRVVRHLRVPRAATGLLVGLALGAAGALVQAVTRNPLGGPDILGVNAGASLAVVAGIAVLGPTGYTGYVWFAFAGAAAASLAVHAVGSLGRGGPAPVRLALAGAAVTALLGAVTSALTLLDVTTLNAYRFWVGGSLGAADGATAAALAPFVLAGAVTAAALARPLNALALGDDLAGGVGARPRAVRAAAGAAVVLLAGAAVAAAGPIGFVGLMAPHVARAVAGTDHRWVLPWSAATGAVLLRAADGAGRRAVRPQELQAGIVTALVGAPFFLYLVRRRTMVLP